MQGRGLGRGRHSDAIGKRLSDGRFGERGIFVQGGGTGRGEGNAVYIAGPVNLSHPNGRAQSGHGIVVKGVVELNLSLVGEGHNRRQPGVGLGLIDHAQGYAGRDGVLIGSAGIKIPGGHAGGRIVGRGQVCQGVSRRHFNARHADASVAHAHGENIFQDCIIGRGCTVVGDVNGIGNQLVGGHNRAINGSGQFGHAEVWLAHVYRFNVGNCCGGPVDGVVAHSRGVGQRDVVELRMDQIEYPGPVDDDEDIVVIGDYTTLRTGYSSNLKYAYYEFGIKFNETGTGTIMVTNPRNNTEYEDDTHLEANVSGSVTFNVISPGDMTVIISDMVDAVMVDDTVGCCWVNESDVITIEIFGDSQDDPMNASIEITGCGLDISEDEEDAEYKKLLDGVSVAVHQGLGINAGHGLNYFNVRRIAEIEEIEELSIGHSIVARAVLVGLDRAVRDMIQLIR